MDTTSPLCTECGRSQVTTKGFETLIFLGPDGKPKPCRGSKENPVITQVVKVLGTRWRFEYFPSELLQELQFYYLFNVFVLRFFYPDEKLVKSHVSAISSVR